MVKTALRAEEPQTYAVVVFPGSTRAVLPVLLASYKRPGEGITVRCKNCLWDIDDIFDKPSAHHAACEKEGANVLAREQNRRGAKND